MEDGLLGFLSSPAGAGLLSAVAGGMAGARRGTPWNNFGRAGLAGLTGYSQAQDDITKNAQLEEATKARNLDMQMKQAQLDQIQGQQKWRADLPNIEAQAQPKIEAFHPDDPFNQGSSEFGSMSTVKPGDQEGLRKHLMGQYSPVADKFMEQKFFPKDDAYTLSPGAQRFKGDKLIASAPTEQKDNKPDSKIQQYEYAKKNGYKGSFEQFVTLGPTIMAGAMAPLREAQVDDIKQENAYKLPRKSSAGVSITTPDGKTFTFKDQASANKFKFEAGIK